MPKTTPEALLILTAARTQIEAGIAPLESARDNLLALGMTPTRINTALVHARASLYDITKRIEQLALIRAGARK